MTIKVMKIDGDETKKSLPLYDGHYPKEYFLNKIRESQLLRESYPSMNENANIPTIFIDLITDTPARTSAALNARIYSLTNAILGDNVLNDQLAYLRRTLKPRQLSIED